MKYGGKDYEIGIIDAPTLLQLTKFIAKVTREVREDQENIEQEGFASLLNILSTTHLYELTAIFLGIPTKEAEEGWNVVVFTELLAEVAEHNDLDAIVKNLQRVVAAYQH